MYLWQDCSWDSGALHARQVAVAEQSHFLEMEGTLRDDRGGELCSAVLLWVGALVEVAEDR